MLFMCLVNPNISCLSTTPKLAYHRHSVLHGTLLLNGLNQLLDIAVFEKMHDLLAQLVIEAELDESPEKGDTQEKLVGDESLD